MGANVLHTCFALFDRIGHYEHANWCLEEVARLQSEEDNLREEFDALLKLCDLHKRLGNRDQLAEVSARLWALAEKIDNENRNGMLVMVAKAHSVAASGNVAEGLQLAHEAVGIFHADNDPLSEAEAWSAIVDLNVQSNKKQPALEAAMKCRKVLQATDKVIKAAAAYQTEAELHLQNGDFSAAMRTAWQGQLACKGAKHLQGE